MRDRHVRHAVAAAAGEGSASVGEEATVAPVQGTAAVFFNYNFRDGEATLDAAAVHAGV